MSQRESDLSDALLGQDLHTLVLDELFDCRASGHAGSLNWQAFEREAITEAIDLVLNTSGQYNLIDESRAADGEEHTSEIFNSELFEYLQACPTPELGGDHGPYVAAVKRFRDDQGIGATLQQRAEQRLRAGAGLLRAGWCPAGEWTCAKCGTMLGKNLNGDSPFALAREHVAAGCPEDRLAAVRS